MRNDDNKSFFEMMDDRAIDYLEDGESVGDMLYGIGCMLRSIACSLAKLADQYTPSCEENEIDAMEDPDTMNNEFNTVEPDEK